MSTDGITLETDMSKCAADYGRRCEKIGEERRTPQDLDDAMRHPSFKAEHHSLLDRLAKEYRNSLPLFERPARFTLDLGGWKSKKDMIAAVKGAGHQFSDWATQVIDNKKFVLLGSPGKYEFIETTVKELTGCDQLTTTELYAAQERLGFCVAPHESACAVRIAYTDQPMDEWRAILSEPVAGANGLLMVLRVVRRSRGSWVSGNFAYPGLVWFGRDRLFVCRKCK